MTNLADGIVLAVYTLGAGMVADAAHDLARHWHRPRVLRKLIEARAEDADLDEWINQLRLNREPTDDQDQADTEGRSAHRSRWGSAVLFRARPESDQSR